MSVLDFYKLGEAIRKPVEHRCKHCLDVFKPRSPVDDRYPGYCSYQCGANAQPDKCKPVLRHDYSGNNQKS